MASRRRKEAPEEQRRAEELDEDAIVLDGSVVAEVGAPLQPADVDEFVRLQDASVRTAHLRTFIRAWSQQQKDERALRRAYATALITILAVELALTFVAFYLVVLGLAKADRWAVQAFLVTALVQSAALVMVVVRYLFPDRTADVLRLIEGSFPRATEATGKRRRNT